MRSTNILLSVFVLFASFAANAETVKVLPGETLMTFSNRVFGTHQKWRQILNWNKDVIKDPNRIEPGLELQVEGMAPQAGITASPPSKPRKTPSIRKLSSTEEVHVVRPVTEKPIEQPEVAADRPEEHVAPADSAHTPAGRAAIFPGVVHVDSDTERLEPFSSLEVPR